jgi:hypothetical protein
LMVAGEIPANRVVATVAGWGRAQLVKGFLDTVGLDQDLLTDKLREVVGFKVQDPNMSPAEQRAMWQVVERFEAST